MLRKILAATLLIAGTTMLGTTSAQMGPGMTQGGMGGMSGMGMHGMGANPRMHRARNCADTIDPATCEANRVARAEARKKAEEKCKGARSPDYQMCVRNTMMTEMDCRSDTNPAACDAAKKTFEPCKEKVGPEFRQCMRDAEPAADCDLSKNKARCENFEKARVSCKGKPDSEYRPCLRQQANAAQSPSDKAAAPVSDPVNKP